jgi:pimeloyl-ACP methyl ester carboxylesterase
VANVGPSGDTVGVETSLFTLASGRRVGVSEFGDPNAERVIVLSHPAPGSSVFDPDPAVTAGREVRVIALDRPGYGESELDEPISVARAAEDIAEYLAAQKISTVGAAGWSAGGRIVLALAAAHPDLVDRVAVIASPAPDDGVPWVGERRPLLDALAALPPKEAFTTFLGQFNQFFGEHPTAESQLGQLQTPGVDDGMTEVGTQRVLEMLHHAMAQGNAGAVADIISYMLLDLGFSLDDVRAKTLLLYGGADSIIGGAHGRWYQKHLADARLEMVPNAGHLLMIGAWDRVLSHLAPGSKAR